MITWLLLKQKANKQTLFSSGDYITHKSDEWAVFKAMVRGKHLDNLSPVAVCCRIWYSDGGWPLEALFLPCTYLAACCFFSSRACVPFPGYIWWYHSLFFSVAFLTALLSLCYKVQNCFLRHLGLGGLQVNWFCHCLWAARAAEKLCAVLREVRTAKEVTFTDPAYTQCMLYSALYMLLKSLTDTWSEWQTRISLRRTSVKTCVNQCLLGSCCGDFP